MRGIRLKCSHDTDPNDIAGSAVPMREVDLAVRETLLAERVVILADTCHSAGIAQRLGGRATNTASVVNRYLEEMGKSKAGIAWLTSAEQTQVSLEDAKWGGGHGVFTHFLLEGMRGAADNPRDGVVSVGELFEYVRHQVKEATGNQQHPCIGSNPFDRTLPMAITAQLNAQEHFEIGCGLDELGRTLNDRSILDIAANQLRMATKLMGQDKFPEAEFRLGVNRLAYGDFEQAAEHLAKADHADVNATLPEAGFYLGFSLAEQKDLEAATSSFDKFSKRYPKHHLSDVATQLSNQLVRSAEATLHVLLMGVGEFASPGQRQLPGPGNDVDLMSNLLERKLGADRLKMSILRNEECTRQRVLAAFESLRETRREDIAIVFFSGLANEAPLSEEGVLYLHDTQFSPFSRETAISAAELDAQLRCIPAAQKTVILDTCFVNNLIALAEPNPQYVLWCAAASGERASETSGDRPHGAFTWSFAEALERTSEDTNNDELLSLVKSELQKIQCSQTPFRINGSGERPNIRPVASESSCLQVVDASLRRNFDSFTAAQLHRLRKHAERNLDVPFPEFYIGVGRGYLQKGEYSLASECLQHAANREGGSPEAIRLSLVMALLRVGRYADAQTMLEQHVSDNNTSGYNEAIQEVINNMKLLAEGRKYALLVGIDAYPANEPPALGEKPSRENLPTLMGAVNDVFALREALIKSAGFCRDDIQVLVDGDGTRSTVLEAFQKLVARSRIAPALFYFSGLGSIDVDDQPTLVCADSRQSDVFDDIELGALAKMAENGDTNLVTIIDAGWTPMVILDKDPVKIMEKQRKRRSVSPNYRVKPLSRTLDLASRETPRTLDLSLIKIGRISIYNDSIRYKGKHPVVDIEREFTIEGQEARTEIRGVMSFYLAQTLEQSGSVELTYQSWIEAAAAKESLDFLGVPDDHLREGVFRNSVLERKTYGILRKLELQPIRKVIVMLQRLIEQHGGVHAEAHLGLGVAYATVGELDRSVEALQLAIQQRHGEYDEARYHLGRVLFEDRRDLYQATSELRKVTESDFANAAAWYYLGQALRDFAQQDILSESQSALRNYLDAGAPLGHAEEIRQFLAAREVPSVESAPATR